MILQDHHQKNIEKGVKKWKKMERRPKKIG